jgi:hypothetical protein
VVIQDGMYSRFAKHVETVCLDPAVSFEVAPSVRTIADQILHSPTRVMLCEAVNQGFYNPITELREQLR